MKTALLIIFSLFAIGCSKTPALTPFYGLENSTWYDSRNHDTKWSFSGGHLTVSSFSEPPIFYNYRISNDTLLIYQLMFVYTFKVSNTTLSLTDIRTSEGLMYFRIH